MKNVNNLQIVKVQPQGVAYSIYLIFCQFQPGIAYKSVTYKKSVSMFLKTYEIVQLSYAFITHNFTKYHSKEALLTISNKEA